MEPSCSFTEQEKCGGPRHSNASPMRSHINNTTYHWQKNKNITFSATCVLLGSVTLFLIDFHKKQLRKKHRHKHKALQGTRSGQYQWNYIYTVYGQYNVLTRPHAMTSEPAFHELFKKSGDNCRNFQECLKFLLSNCKYFCPMLIYVHCATSRKPVTSVKKSRIPLPVVSASEVVSIAGLVPVLLLPVMLHAPENLLCWWEDQHLPPESSGGQI